jgi:hypothetical protein
MNTTTGSITLNIADTDKNRHGLLELARMANRWDGSFDFSDTYETLDDMFPDVSAKITGPFATEGGLEWFKDRIVYGSISPWDDLYTLDGNGNIATTTEEKILEEAWENRDDIIEYMEMEPDALEGESIADHLDYTETLD